MKKSSFISYAGRHILAWVLSAAMIASLTACGGKDGGADGVEQVKEWVYVPEFQTIEDENVRYYDTYFTNDRLYYISRSWDEESGRSSETLCFYSPIDKKAETAAAIIWPEDTETGNQSIRQFAIAEDGSLYALVYTYGGENTEPKQYLCKFDAQGNWAFSKEMANGSQEGANVFYAQNMALDGQGRIYLSDSSSTVQLYDAEGNYVGVISVGSGDNIWIERMFLKEDGKVSVVYNSYDGNGSSTTLAELDFEGKKLGNSYDEFPNSARSIVPGADGKFLINDSTRVYEYDPEKKEKTELFEWLDSDINGTFVESFGLMEDGRVLAVIQDWETEDSGVALLTRTKASEVPQKETITIATIGGGYDLRSLAVKFNKASSQYHISVKEYIDYDSRSENAYSDAITNLNNDITSSNTPDIIDLAGLNVSQLAAKGVFEDLNGYLEKSGVLSRSDIMENVLEAYTYDGKLVSVPASFSVQTLVGHKSKLGDKKGWTLGEMIAYADANPDADLFDRVSKTEILQYLMMMNEGEFVDWSEGKCNFDTDIFKSLLEFVNRYPDEVDWDSSAPVTPIRVQNGEVLLYPEGIYDFRTIQEALDVFNGDAVCIGFPTVDGSSGHALTGRNAYAIAAKSDSKDGAWAFIESVLTQDNTRGRNGFPVIISRLNALAEDAVKIEYAIDEETGEPYLDENGEPIIQNAGGGIGWGDWFYEYHVPTQEEVDMVMEVMREAKPMSYNDSDEIMSIVLEEAQPFFKGQKTADEVTGIIQNRVNIYINENR